MTRARDAGAMVRICLDGVNTIAVAAKEIQERKKALQAIYAGTHEGALPPLTMKTMAAPTPFRGDLVELGALVAITYRTRKGPSKGKQRYGDWEHEFRTGHLPVLAFNDTGLVILGGDYKVTSRGIVG